jgi:hypothetical protein
MTTSKLRIDLSQGIIEAEGSDDFVLAVYTDFKERLKFEGPKHAAPPAPTNPHAAANETKPAKVAATNGATKGRKKSRESLSIVKDLDLSKGKLGRLKDFYGRYDAKTNFQRNLVFVYFLQNGLEISGITENHVYTCYRDVSAKLPGAFRQSLFDTANKNGWIDTSDMSNITVATPGINYLEHDLSKKVVE